MRHLPAAARSSEADAFLDPWTPAFYDLGCADAVYTISMKGTAMSDRYRKYLVETDWLADHLADPDLRIIDATVVMRKDSTGAWKPSSGRGAYDKAHIPHAQFVDLLTGLQDTNSRFTHMLPPADDFAAAMAALGIGNDNRVVVYSSAVPWWATRFWWMLRTYGHDNVAVLNGGLQKWQAEDKPLTDEVLSAAPATFMPRYRPDLVATKDSVLAALDNTDARVVNALSPQLFAGDSDLGYGRRGRIAGSVNLSALALVDTETWAYLPSDALERAVNDAIGGQTGDVICYCGGGIAATMDAFVLALLGRDDVAVYDASLQEWAADPNLPMAVG